MPSAGPTPGRLAEVEIHTAAGAAFDAGTYVAVERVNSPAFAGSGKKADSSSNDSGGAEEHVTTWTSATFSFEMIADGTHATTGQRHLWDMFLANEKRGVTFLPTGNVEGDTRYRFLASIDSIEDAGPKEGARAFKVTMTRSGEVDIDTVPAA